MSGALDLRRFLESWPYDPRDNVRVALDENGREIMVVRQPMGLESYETDGRPDGRQPHGMESALDFQVSRCGAAVKTGTGARFQLTTAECVELFDEGALYHHRFVHFFRIRDWPRVARDAARNLCLIDFVKLHAAQKEDRVQLEPWRPATARIKAVAEVMTLLESEQLEEARHLARGLLAAPDGTGFSLPQMSRKLADTLLASVGESLAFCPTVRAHEESVFVREGDYWRVRYQGQAAHFKAARGLDCLRYLLRHPGREIHVSELLATLLEASAPAMLEGWRENGAPTVSAGFRDAGPILDSQSKADYKSRIDDLRKDVEEAERFNDSHRAASARSEMEAITHQLAAAVGLGGRDRRASSEADRARSAVTKRVKESMKKIAEVMPALGCHLSARIKTGYFCSYTPHPDRPVAWKF